MKNKCIALFLTFLMTAALLAGCTAPDQTASPSVPPASGSSGTEESSSQPAETDAPLAAEPWWDEEQAVPLSAGNPSVDESKKDILKGYDWFAPFYNGYAFVVQGLSCGYVRESDGQFIHLYDIPSLDVLIMKNGPTLGQNRIEYYLTEWLQDHFGYSEGLVPYFGEDAWGYCDMDGNIAIQPQFCEVGQFGGGHAGVLLPNAPPYNFVRGEGGSAGGVTDMIIDRNGNIVLTRNDAPADGNSLGYHHQYGLVQTQGRLYTLDGTLVADSEDTGAGNILDRFRIGPNSIYYGGSGNDLVWDFEGNLVFEYRSEDGRTSRRVDYGPSNGYICSFENDTKEYAIIGPGGHIVMYSGSPVRWGSWGTLVMERVRYDDAWGVTIHLYDTEGAILQEDVPFVQHAGSDKGFALRDGAMNHIFESDSKRYVHRGSSDIYFTDHYFYLFGEEGIETYRVVFS